MWILWVLFFVSLILIVYYSVLSVYYFLLLLLTPFTIGVKTDGELRAEELQREHEKIFSDHEKFLNEEAEREYFPEDFKSNACEVDENGIPYL